MTVKNYLCDILFCIFVAVLFTAIFIPISSAEAGRPLKGTMYAGIWCPSVSTTANFDESLNGEDINARDSEINRFIVSLIKENPIIIKTLDLYFPEKEKRRKHSRIFTIVLSRATDAVIEYDVKSEHLEQHFFDVTASIVVVNPNTSQIEYSRILTGELPVLEPYSISTGKKKEYFKKVIKKTITDLIAATAQEFKINLSREDPDYYFQVTNIKVKPEAQALSPYKNELKQFLHDALIVRAEEAAMNVYFLPPESAWDSNIWRQFSNNYEIEGHIDFGSKKRYVLIKNNRFLSVSIIIQKLKKAVLKQNNLEAYFSYLAYTAGGVVLRNTDMKKIAVYPTKIPKKDRLARGSAGIDFHEVKGITRTKSDHILFLDASQQSLAKLSHSLIKLCGMAQKELLYDEDE